jgi:hypothetical protein
MNPYFRYLTMIGVALVLGLAIFFTGQMKSDNSKTFMGVGGDPRMRLCTGPADAELADGDVLKAMQLEGPLVRGPEDKAAYRISVLRPKGQESLSITFLTPKDKAGAVQVVRWSVGAVTQAEADVSVTDAANLVYAIKDARIWDAVKPTIETLARAGNASSVIEIKSPAHDRCVTTRYDDERVRPLLNAFVTRIGPLVPNIALEGMEAPVARFVPVAPASPAAKGP